MSARKDLEKLEKDLRRDGWKVSRHGSETRAEHPQGGVVRFSANHPEIRQARTHIRRIETAHAETNRQLIRARNAATGGTVSQPERSKPVMLNDPTSKLPVNDRPQKKNDDAVLDLLVELSTKLDIIQSGMTSVAAAVGSLGNAVSKINARHEEEQQRKADQQAWDRRMAFLDAELKDLPAQAAKAVQFDNETELVATTKVVNAYGASKHREFKTTREGLHVSFWRVK